MVFNLKTMAAFFLRPVFILREYTLQKFRFDIVAGGTVAVILLPQAIAYAVVAELPPQMGIYAATLAAVGGGLWGASSHLHTGPTNTSSLLVLSVLLPIAPPGSPEFIAAAGLLTIMAGLFRVVMGLARLGILVNFVSDSVIVGFTAGVGTLVSVGQLRHLLRLDFAGETSVVGIMESVIRHLPETHSWSLGLGLSTIILLLLLKRLAPKWPAPLIVLVVASLAVGVFGLLDKGVSVLGQLPRGMPPFINLSFLNLDVLGILSTGALAVAAIGLVEATSIGRALSAQTGERLDSNQEFIGQGVANIVTGMFSGYAASGSFSRSAVNFEAGARTSISSVFSGLFVFAATFIFAPWVAFLPLAALAGVLIVTSFGMVDGREMLRIWRSSRGDAMIMSATLLATLLLPLEFAVLTGILFSFARYAFRTSMPRVQVVLPDDDFNHLIPRPQKTPCPQLGIVDILGDLYFGAVSHVEEAIRDYRAHNPDHRFLLLRLRSVNHCDISGIHMLEAVLRMYRETNGDLYLMRVPGPIRALMISTGFAERLGHNHFLSDDGAVSYLFQHILDPAICIYECNVRAFYECQNLPKSTFPEVAFHMVDIPTDDVNLILPHDLWQQLRFNNGRGAAEPPMMVLDVREPREFRQGHIPQAILLPLSRFVNAPLAVNLDTPIVCVCRGGRRSLRAAAMLSRQGFTNVRVLQGGILAWAAAGLLEAVDW